MSNEIVLVPIRMNPDGTYLWRSIELQPKRQPVANTETEELDEDTYNPDADTCLWDNYTGEGDAR